MCVKVTGSTTCWFISIQNFDANLSCFSTLQHYVTCSGCAKFEAFGWHDCESPSQLRSKLDHLVDHLLYDLVHSVTFGQEMTLTTRSTRHCWLKVETTCAGAANRTRRRTQVVRILTWPSLWLVQRCGTACVQPFAALCGRCCGTLQAQHHLEVPPSRQ